MNIETLFGQSSTGGDSGLILKSDKEIDTMRKAGKVVALMLDKLQKSVYPGMSTQELDVIAAAEIKRLGAKPAFLGYYGFPATICVSVNDQIVHGIPGTLTIRSGDIVSIDAGAIVDGFYGDAAITIGVGEISSEAQSLIDITRNALTHGIAAVKAGNRIGDIGANIQQYVESQGSFGIVREYVGHGIGRSLHEDPPIPNFGAPGMGPLLEIGMVIAIEPMINIGAKETKTLGDGWTVTTTDGSLSAHFEHTVAVNESGFEILTTV